jgi:hypothetical protein
MTIKRKASKLQEHVQEDIQDVIDQVISRGGKTANDDTSSQGDREKEEVRFTLRIPCGLIKKIDTSRESRVGNVSRNQWIIETISNAVK